MEISRVNDLQLMLTGVPTPSWLAGRSYKIDLDGTVEKLLAHKGQFLKVNHTTCLVFGKTLADEVLLEWERSRPNGVVLHKLDDQQRSDLMDWLGKSA